MLNRARSIQCGCSTRTLRCRSVALPTLAANRQDRQTRIDGRRHFWKPSVDARNSSVQSRYSWRWPLAFCAATASVVWLSSASQKKGYEGSKSDDTNLDKLDIAKVKTEKDNNSWGGLEFLRNSIPITELSATLSTWKWPESLSSFQTKFSALVLELGRGPGSLYSEIVYDPPDPSIHPECQWDAEVRLGDELCLSERAFLRERRRRMKGGFARLFEVDEREIDERDLPVVAIAGSGGGYRAMINTISSLSGAHQSGILDCVTYTSGISGSCWALGVMYSGVAGSATPEEAAQHIVESIGISYLDASTLDMLITAPTHKYLLYGLLRKATSPGSDVSLTDLYGTLVSARLFVPRDINKLDPRHLSLYHFRNTIDDGSLPLPIFMAVRHEVPLSMEGPLSKAKTRQADSIVSSTIESSRLEEEEIEQQSSWLWFEFTPYEIGCDELGAWIPSWSFGRRFINGKSIHRNPELGLTILNGIYASAFCATLQHYFVEIQPLLKQLPAPLYKWFDEIINDNKEEFSSVHPVLPNELPNFVKGLTGQLRRGSPPDITDRDTLGLMDAGAELNIPYYPLFRRDVDCIIALDASADSQDLWFTRAEKYAAKRGLSRWPMGAKWPAMFAKSSSDSTSEIEIHADTDAKNSTDSESDAANRALAEAQEREVTGQASKLVEADRRSKEDSTSSASRSPQSPATTQSRDPQTIPSSTIWIGSSTPSPSSTASLMESLEEEDLLHRDGIAIVYNPLVPNDAVAPGFDPMNVSTWVVRMDKEEAEILGRVAEANFLEGKEKIVKLLRAIWLRKRNKRLESEDAEQSRRDDLALHPLAYHP